MCGLGVHGLEDRLETVLGRRPSALLHVGGGTGAQVFEALVPVGQRLAVKVSSTGGLDTEGWMLEYLRANSELPVPAVVYCEAGLLVMEFVGSGGRGNADVHAAELLASLHAITADAYGLERDTLIGGLPQPNRPSSRWLPFFREQRLLSFGRKALDAGLLDPASFTRLEQLCDGLEDRLPEPPAPSLIHGDVWGGNVLVRDGRVAAFIDPALYYADAEIEIAFTTLFSTFGRDFYRHYREIRGLDDGSIESRHEIYNLYPLLVHTLLFGASYARALDASLQRLLS